MNDTMTRFLAAIHDRKTAYNLRKITDPLIDQLSSSPLNTAGLVISAGGATTAKIGASDFYAIANGTLVKIAAGTVMPALTGINAPAANYQLAMFFVNSAGVVTASGGTAGATLAAV
jgi:hypothetical protein